MERRPWAAFFAWSGGERAKKKPRLRHGSSGEGWLSLYGQHRRNGTKKQEVRSGMSFLQRTVHKGGRRKRFLNEFLQKGREWLAFMEFVVYNRR